MGGKRRSGGVSFNHGIAFGTSIKYAIPNFPEFEDLRQKIIGYEEFGSSKIRQQERFSE